MDEIRSVFRARRERFDCFPTAVEERKRIIRAKEVRFDQRLGGPRCNFDLEKTPIHIEGFLVGHGQANVLAARLRMCSDHRSDLRR